MLMIMVRDVGEVDVGLFNEIVRGGGGVSFRVVHVLQQLGSHNGKLGSHTCVHV